MIFVYILAGIVAILGLLILIAPKSYGVSRNITVNRSLPEVYNYLKMIKNQDQWAPWSKRDPDMKQTFTGQDGTIGFISHWESDHKQVGAGEQEIVKLDENKRIETALRFFKPWKSESNGFFDLHDAGEGATKVSWGFYGNHKIPMNVMMLFFNMDKAVGKDFEEGLADLKSTLES